MPLYIIFFLILSVKSGEMFRDIKKLSLTDNYFVVLSTGLFLYDSNFLNCSLIYKFNTSIYKDKTTKVFTAEINNKVNSYILCLVNQYLFIFNSKTNESNIHYLNDIDIINNLYCNFMPYRIYKNNIYFIISIYKDSHLKFYKYYFSIRDNIVNKSLEFDFPLTNIASGKIDCQINSYLSYINCYYSLNNNKFYLLSTRFLIEDMKIIINQTTNYTLANCVNNTIKSALSFNNKFFICIISDSQKQMVCYINDISTNEFEKVNCTFRTGFGSGYKVSYFNETGDFMMTSQTELETGIVSSFNNELKKCSAFDMFPRQNGRTDFYSIIYNNNSIKNYTLVNYTNFKNNSQCTYISMLTEFTDIFILYS